MSTSPIRTRHDYQQVLRQRVDVHEMRNPQFVGGKVYVADGTLGADPFNCSIHRA